MKTTFLSCILIALATFTNCASTEVADSSDVNQKKIYQAYDVSLSENGLGAQADAQFRFGGELGTTLTLSAPAQVALNGNPMNGEERFLQGFVYRTPLHNADRDFTFEYTNADGDLFTNGLTLEPIRLENLPAEISCADGVTIPWEGAPVGSNETVTVNITDSDHNVVTRSSSAVGATSISFDQQALMRLYNGSATIDVTRQFSKGLDMGVDEGGHINGTYSSNSHSLQLIDGNTPVTTGASGGGNSGSAQGS